MGDEDRAALVSLLAADPAAGVALGGGLCKMRLARPGGCKSSRWRVLHFFLRRVDAGVPTLGVGQEREGGHHGGGAGGTDGDLRPDRRDLREAQMSEAHQSVGRGLEEALAHAEGRRDCAVTHELRVPEPDVAAIRARPGLSQTAFARSIGVAVGALRDWEQGRRRPEGPARVLLALIEKRLSLVQEALGEGL
jgi:putative transcriptional regulator